MSAVTNKADVGEVRPSQVMTTFGIGSIIDLPYLSIMVMGLDDWQTAHAAEVVDERLLLSVQQSLGQEVKKLYTPPRPPESVAYNPFEDTALVGMPVAPFPRWMLCPHCRLLAPLSSGLFEFKADPYRPDRARYVHIGCTTQVKPPVVVPARFVVACPHGHLNDFPWVWFVHRGDSECRYRLRLYELGASGEAADVEVFCEVCKLRRRMAEAFGRENAVNLPACRGRRPHLRDFDPKNCDVPHVTAMLQGASNSWFPVLLTALSVPNTGDNLAQLVEDHWPVLEIVESERDVKMLRHAGNLRDFAAHTDAEVLEAVQKKRLGGGDGDGEPTDLKTPEWDIFSNPAASKTTDNFKLREVSPPEGYKHFFEKVVLVERLREVRALIGFTRIESPGDYDTAFQVPKDRLAPLSRVAPKWVPASEIRGEGIFLQFNETAIKKWTSRVKAHDKVFVEAHRAWRESRKLDPDEGYPSLRYVLLHSFAHTVIRQLAVECGYTAASIRERIYSRNPGDQGPMAGVLIYTAAPDSQGTLGGLVSLGEPDTLGRHLDQALEAVRLCASDPLCAEHHPRESLTLHAAACHACLFAPETSCERGNKYLDRSVLVGTVQRADLAFFEEGDGAKETPSAGKKEAKAKPAKGKDAEVEELLTYADERCHGIIRTCAARSLPLPVVGYELLGPQGKVCADAELAWPSQKVAVLLPDRMDAAPVFEGTGWKVFSVADLTDPQPLLALLKE
jgi:hypothetical protein